MKENFFISNLLRGALWGKLQTSYPQDNLRVSIGSTQEPFDSLTGRLRDDNYPRVSGARVAREWLKYAAVFLLIFTFGVGNALGDSYTITFKTGSNADGTAIASNTNLSDVFTASTYVTSMDTYTKTYYGSSSGLKLGASSNAGDFKFSLTSAGQQKVDSIIVSAKSYSSNSNKKGSIQILTNIGSNSSTTTTTSWANYKYTPDSKTNATTYIELKSGKYTYVASVTVYYSATPSGYTLGYSVSPTGKADVTLGSTSLAEDATTTATYSNVATGYEFLYWSISGTGATLSSADGSGHSTANPVTVTMGTQNATVTANLQCITPSIDTQPSNGSCVQNGTPTALSVVATGATGYQWQKCATSNGTFTDVTENTDGTGSQTSSFSPVTSSIGTMYYKCVVKNTGSDCNTSVTSNAVSFEVTAPVAATITLVNYSGSATTTGYTSGQSFTLPSTNDFTCGELTFVGWSTVAIANSATKPSSNYYEPGASVTLGASNTFYAVFAESSGSGTTSSSISSYTDGTYYLIDSFTDAESNTSYRSPTGTANNAKLSSVDLTTDVSVTNDVLTLDITSASLANAMKYTISRVYDSDYDKYYYRIYNATAEAYVEPNTGTNFKNSSTTPWEVLSENNRFMFWYDATTDRCFLYQDSYSNSGTKTYGRQFGCYAKSGAGTITAQSGKECYGSGYFFLVPATAAATYTNYTTNCVNLTTVYLDAYHFGDTDGAKFAIYSWKNGSDPLDDKLAEAFMTKVEDCYYGHLYEGEMPDNHDRVIFLRNASAATVPVKEGANKLNQTSNITTEANKDFFTISSGGSGDTYTGSWGVYTPNYAVTFSKNGVTTTNTWPADQCVASGSAATDPNVTPLTMGKTFVGWYQEAGGTNAWNFSTTISEATTIYAKWNDVATKTIYLDASATLDGGNRWDADNTVLFARAYINGTSLGTNVTPDGDGPISTCQPHVYAFTIPGNADYVSFARCATNTTELPASWTNPPVYNQIVGKAIESGKDHYVIDGWGSATLQSSAFTPVSYAISYNAGTNGSGTRADDSKACGVAFTLPNTQVFTRNGYTMDGWATEDEGSKVYELGGSYTTDAAQTFYPHWALASYDVTLNTNGGTINAGNVTSYTYGTGATLPTDVTKSHATFQGWYAASNFSGERVYSIGAAEYGDKEYWAKWEAITYTVTWKANGATVRTDENVTEGDKVASVPSAPSDLTTSPDGCNAEFVGWVISGSDPGALSISSQTSAPAGMFTDVAGSPAITGNTTFVAIYRQEQ